MHKSTRIIGAAAVTAVALAVFSGTLVHALWYAPQDSSYGLAAASSTHDTARAVAAAGDPSRLIIPSLNIDAHVQEVGLTYAGNVGIPSNFTDVAWYKLGATPGAAGTAIIDGHVDNGLGLAGVFKHLGDIRTGDQIFVQTTKGTLLRFVVADITAYPYQQVPMSQILAATSTPGLDLITCEGAWVQGGRTYDHRLFVHAVLEG